MDDFIYLEDGIVKVSDMAMEIPEFKDFKRYDTSTNKVFFYKSMAYIYYVYKVFGDERSYVSNLPLIQRQNKVVKHHTGTYTNVSDFEDNKWVKLCIEAYLKYSRTAKEKLFDALKDDIERYINYVQNIPYTFVKKIKVPHKVLDEDDQEGKMMVERLFDVEIDVPFVTGRIDALKQASDLSDLFDKTLAAVNKETKKKNKSQTRIFEDQKFVKNIPLNSIPTATK